MSFLTELDRSSYPLVEALVQKHVTSKAHMKSILKQPIPQPSSGKFLQFEGYWVPAGGEKPRVPPEYVLTKSIRANLRDLARIVSAG